MKSTSNLGKMVLAGIVLLMMAGLLSLVAFPADRPLSKDDITLLLYGSPSAKIIQEVEQRGVDFQMNPDLAKKFHDQGASDDLIDALTKAGSKAAKASSPAPAPSSAPPSAPAPAPPPASPAANNPNPPAAPDAAPTLKPNAPDAGPSLKPNAPDAPEPPAAEAPRGTPAPSTVTAPPTSSSSSSEPVLLRKTQAPDAASSPANSPSPAPATPVPASAPSAAPATPSSSEPVLHVPAQKPTPAAAETPIVSNAPGLKDPDAQGIQHIISEFAAKEKIFRAARNNYTYHQINKVEEFGAGKEIVGTFEQEWDILYDDSGKRIEKVTYAPETP